MVTDWSIFKLSWFNVPLTRATPSFATTNTGWSPQQCIVVLYWLFPAELCYIAESGLADHITNELARSRCCTLLKLISCWKLGHGASTVCYALWLRCWLTHKSNNQLAKVVLRWRTENKIGNSRREMKFRELIISFTMVQRKINEINGYSINKSSNDWCVATRAAGLFNCIKCNKFPCIFFLLFYPPWFIK